MYMSTSERKFELSEILTKLLNPREGEWMIFGRKNIRNFLIKKHQFFTLWTIKCFLKIYNSKHSQLTRKESGIDIDLIAAT